MIFHNKNNDKESIYRLQKEIQIFEEIYENYKNLFNSKSLISYSGGKDSSLLVHFFLYLHKKKNIPKPILFHLDHSIRDNQLQENLIKEFMNSLSLEFFFIKKNIPKLSIKIKKSLEETGRDYRYKALRKIAKQEKAIIITGHHTEDYLESVLINLIRGGGRKAMETLPFYNGELFRPLVFINKGDRIKLLNDISMPIFEDESNESQFFLRNRLRKTVVGSLEKEGLSFQKLYFNFHNKDLDILSPTKKSSSYYSVSDSGLNDLNPSQLKNLIDIYLKLLKYHPIKLKILMELYYVLKKNNVLFQENKEVIFWKSPKSPLYIIDKKSDLFQDPYIKDEKIYWNSKEKNIKVNYQISKNNYGMKILKNNQNKNISELMRQFNIPSPVRKYLPILTENNISKAILFSLWDDKLRDYYGD
jgi:tRNA(Ile)-lysidine synthase